MIIAPPIKQLYQRIHDLHILNKLTVKFLISWNIKQNNNNEQIIIFS